MTSQDDSDHFDANHADALLVWDYHQVNQMPVVSDIGLALGSHDLGVADHAVELYRRGLFPLIVFSGATSPTTAKVFPDGEAVAYRDRALALGVPNEAVLIETAARNTGENFSLTRSMLSARGIQPSSAVVISKPYMQRRAVATAGMVWPELSITCSADDLSYDEYVEVLGDEKLVIDMIVGDLQRILVYPDQGFAVAQEVPNRILAAYERLIAAGFTSRLIPT